MKEERLQKYKGCNKLLQRPICQEMWKPRWNGQISRKYNLPKLNEEETESLNRPIKADEIEAVIKKLLVHQSPGPGDYAGEFYKSI